MSLFDLQDVCIAIGSIATLDLPMVVNLIGIYGLKGPYYSIGYPRMSASGESSTTMHRLLHASGSHPIPPPDDPNNDSKGPLIQIKTASQRLTQTTSHSARHHICHQLVIQSQDITRDASSCWYRSQNRNAAFQVNETASHRIRHPIFQQLGATTETNQRLGPQNDVASTNPNDDVLYPLQELSADRYKSAVASQNVTVSKSYTALLLKSSKRCCRQISHNVTLTTPTNGFSTPSTDNRKACVINATHNRDAYVNISATSFTTQN
ncbi:pentatricopeptide repeat-containing protein chloroplastic [Dorcoceras hygrometricum]|uniref:Pentatricopeptide repeat-containing protein chloroplastic n=1 Tax=Dorcoceras hygrometricum TaxID=472368 RepID=A0A2Z7ASL8_9LAMI|nr:pentatricopeptide repeat-containing protein chloroplastic [Dorcoceras hygrometricum]